MNICMVTNTYLPHVGGVANSVAIFAADLSAQGHNVLIIAPEFNTFDNNDKERLPETDVLRLPAIQNFNGSDFSVRLPVPFIVDQAIHDFHPDIIHSHHPYLLGDTALRTAKQYRLPLIFTHHTLYEHYAHYVTGESALMKQFVKHLSTEYANLCDHVIAPSASVRRLIKKRGVKRPVSEIPTGVDCRLFEKGNGGSYRRQHGIDEDALVVGHLGRLAPEKNIGYLAEAVIRFMEKTPKAVFLCVGSGPAENEAKQYFDKKMLNNRLIMPGKQTGVSLVDAYHAMDVFVFASHSETQGMVLTEAMAAGKPVIALDASGVREVVRNEYNGCLLPAGTQPEIFAAALEDFSRSPAKAAAWSSNALETAARFDRNRCAEKLLGIYAETVESFNYRSDFIDQGSPGLDEVVQRIKAEWELASNKVVSLIHAVKE